MVIRFSVGPPRAAHAQQARTRFEYLFFFLGLWAILGHGGHCVVLVVRVFPLANAARTQTHERTHARQNSQSLQTTPNATLLSHHTFHNHSSGKITWRANENSATTQRLAPPMPSLHLDTAGIAPMLCTANVRSLRSPAWHSLTIIQGQPR